MDLTKFRDQAIQLVAQMSLKEMFSQLLHDAPAIPRLGIPRYNWWNEGLHGAARSGTATVFPQAIGLAAMFDDVFLTEIASVISTEQRAKYNTFSTLDDRGIYKGLTLWSPNINIFRDPRWGRGQETYGEDPFLTSRLGVAFIQGLQGDGTYLKTAACIKHFAAHSGPEPLRHGFNAVVSAKDLHETYLPAFEACVKEGKVNAVMGAYSAINGEVCCGSHFLIQDILRNTWGFEGMYISDCWSIRDFHQSHGVTKSQEASAAMALNAGCDLNCGCEYLSLEKAYQKGLIGKENVTQACIRVMTTRFALGLFAEDCPYANIGYEQNDTQEHRELAFKAACNSLVLLKNEGLLPLETKALHSIAVIGPNADSRGALNGNYHGTSSTYITVLEGFRQTLKASVRINYSQGSAIQGEKIERLGEPNDRIAEAIATAQISDVVILCLGYDETVEGEMHDDGNGGWAGDKADLTLPLCQRTLLSSVASTGKPIVLVLFSGGSIDPKIEQFPNVRALIQAWYPGQSGGLAVAHTILGLNNPSGRLPVTFYRSDTLLPDFTNYSMQGRTYRYFKGQVLYPFGFGLSYTTFSYENLFYIQKEDTSLVLSVTIHNKGDREGREVVQVYCFSTHPCTPPNPVLCGFTSIFLRPGEHKTVSLSVAASTFSGIDDEGKRVALKIGFDLYVGCPHHIPIASKSQALDLLHVRIQRD
jgi:beta-glucosidase